MTCRSHTNAPYNLEGIKKDAQDCETLSVVLWCFAHPAMYVNWTGLTPATPATEDEDQRESGGKSWRRACYFGGDS